MLTADLSRRMFGITEGHGTERLCRFILFLALDQNTTLVRFGGLFDVILGPGFVDMPCLADRLRTFCSCAMRFGVLRSPLRLGTQFLQYLVNDVFLQSTTMRG